jgi:hypothetical protein
MKQIPLNKNKVALIDDEDFEEINRHKWCVGSDGYPRRKVIIGGKQQAVFMHRFLMGLVRGDGKEVDHINGNILDNQRKNLRVCSHHQNLINKKLQRNNTSGVRGVSWNKRKEMWQVYIVLNRKKIDLGYFDDLVLAAKRYNQEAKEMFGEFAKLNSL